MQKLTNLVSTFAHRLKPLARNVSQFANTLVEPCFDCGIVLTAPSNRIKSALIAAPSSAVKINGSAKRFAGEIQISKEINALPSSSRKAAKEMRAQGASNIAEWRPTFARPATGKNLTTVL